MEISLRLKTVADMVHEKRLADIGTDHGYVPIYLVKEGRIESALACDINKGPLEKAESNVQANCLADKIETRLGSGLVPVKKGEVDCAVIAGMGGMLIIDILKASADVVEGLNQLVLQPQLDADEVRKYIHSIGFRIEKEEFLLDAGKYYAVISAVKGEEKYETNADYVFGRTNIENKNAVLKEFIEKKLVTNGRILENIAKNGTGGNEEKIEEIEKDNILCREVLERYENK